MMIHSSSFAMKNVMEVEHNFIHNPIDCFITIHLNHFCLSDCKIKAPILPAKFIICNTSNGRTITKCIYSNYINYSVCHLAHGNYTAYCCMDGNVSNIISFSLPRNDSHFEFLIE